MTVNEMGYVCRIRDGIKTGRPFYKIEIVIVL